MQRLLILDTQVFIARDLAETLQTILPDVDIVLRTPPDLEPDLENGEMPTRFDAAFVGADVRKLRGEPALALLARLADRIVQYGAMEMTELEHGGGVHTLLWPFSDAALRRLVGVWTDAP
ncbi:MAG: hypothetical protein GW905_01785 [Rhodobacterales bacterium]|nr:hypothetical protein [Rhodobacterales bacterium]